MKIEISVSLLAGRAARVSFWGGEPYIGQFFVVSAGEILRVSFHTRPNSGGKAPPRTLVQPGLEAGGAARVSSWGGEPYIGQIFAFSSGDFP